MCDQCRADDAVTSHFGADLAAQDVGEFHRDTLNRAPLTPAVVTEVASRLTVTTTPGQEALGQLNTVCIIAARAKRLDHAKRAFERAIQHGHTTAMTNLGLLRKQQDKLTGNDRAEHWWKRACEMGFEPACEALDELRGG